MHWEIDDSELRRLAVDLAAAPGRIQRKAPETLRTKVGPRLVVEMKRDAQGHRFLPRLSKGVTFDMRGMWEVEAGIAPGNGLQGSLAHIIAYGSVNNAPVYDHTAALRRSQRYATDVLADAAEESVLGDGG